MKKILSIILALVLVNSAVEAKNYAKMHMKEMQKNQKYNKTKDFFEYENMSSTETKKAIVSNKDPKVMKLYDYTKIDDSKYNAKLKADEVIYEKYRKQIKGDELENIVTQRAGSDDFYKVYRIMERIIRANNLGYMNWRIVIEKDKSFNAYSASGNCITLYTGLYDTVIDNEDAMALVIGHEMAHALLGHCARKGPLLEKLERSANYAMMQGTKEALLAYKVALRSYQKASREMEYGADNEGAILAAKAGYSLNNAAEMITFLNVIDAGETERFRTHPNGKHRLENFNDNRKYFMEDEWKDYGRYNIYNSDVLSIRVSSDRRSAVIGRNPKASSNNSYRPDTMAQVYGRFGYKSYVYGEYKEALKYFNKMFSVDKSNYSAYLYASYAAEALYKKTGRQGYLEDAKVYAECAKKLAPKDKYVIEQIEAL